MKYYFHNFLSLNDVENNRAVSGWKVEGETDTDFQHNTLSNYSI